LTSDQWRNRVHDIIHFITTEEYLRTILDFDPEMFFFNIEKLFKGRPWQYLSEMRKTKQTVWRLMRYLPNLKPKNSELSRITTAR
jgi:hypothetical protein